MTDKAKHMTQVELAELKPCPFCGCTVIREFHPFERKGIVIDCNRCNGGFHEINEAGARERWNTRASSIPPPSANSYSDAFYELAEMMGIGARSEAPKDVWEREMKPRIAAALEARIPQEVEGFDPCPFCKQYSHSIGEDALAKAFTHFQSMIAHPMRGHPMGDAFDEQTRDAAQVLMAAARRIPQEDELREALRELGDPQDWIDKREELMRWSGSAFLAGEAVGDEMQCKSELYSFLCSLIGWLVTAEEASRAAMAAMSRPQEDEVERLRSALERIATMADDEHPQREAKRALKAALEGRSGDVG